MRVFGLTTGADTAGIGVGIARAFTRHAPDWVVRSMVASQNYIGYPVDVPWHQALLESMYDGADVVMLHNTLHGHRFYDNGQGKPTVIMHHGMKNGSERPFAVMVKDARNIGAVQVCSTLDLSLREPDVAWLPAPTDIRMMRAIRRQNYRPGRRIRVGHAPTNREIKGSDAFDHAIRHLDGLVEPVVIERAKWTDCLRRKATCDVFFDQPVLGYGSNAIEAWAMGIPVISGVADPVIREGMIARWGKLPFYEASEATLQDAIKAMAEDEGLRAEYWARGTQHVERWHDERVTVASLKDIYSSAGPTAPGGSERRFATKLRAAQTARHWRRDQRRALHA